MAAQQPTTLGAAAGASMVQQPAGKKGLWIGLAAVAYCLATVVGSDPRTVVNAMLALLVTVPLYPFFIRSMEVAAARKAVAAVADPPGPAAG